MKQGGGCGAAALVAACAWLGASAGVLAQGVTVSESGQAIYSLPIAVPPGVGGMEPKLSLVYNSGGINGPVGVGWAVQGISQITRCARTERVNGKPAVRAVRLEAGDALCLDGQRLIKVDAGAGNYQGTASADQSQVALGGVATEFRTEVDSYSRIRASGAVDGAQPAYGPATFVVQSKAGLTSEYGRLGTTNDALVRSHRWSAAAGAYQDQHATAWLLKRVTDSVGNTLEFSYDNAVRTWGTKGPNDNVAPGSEWNLVGVKYGCNTRLACNQWHTVTLVYGDRGDKAEAYHQGGKVVNTQLLNRVDVHVGATAGNPGQLVRSYRLAHEASTRTARSVLKTITECADAAGTNCLPPHRFVYTGAVGNYTQALSFNLGSMPLSSWDERHSVITGDFDGNGITDILRTDQWAGQVLAGQGSGFPNVLWLASSTTPGAFVQAERFNDYADSLGAPAASSNTVAVTRLAWKVDSAATDDERVETFAADINGDGRADLIRLCKSLNTTWCPKKVRMWVSMTGSDPSAADFGVFREIDVPAAGPREYDAAGGSLGKAVDGPLYTRQGSSRSVCAVEEDADGTQMYSYRNVSTAQDAIWQDFDGDGRVDLLNFEYSVETVDSFYSFCALSGLPRPKVMHYYAGRGDGTFVRKQAPVALTAAHRTSGEKVKSGLSYMEVMDINGDGRPDVVFRKSRWVQDINGLFVLQNTPIDPSPQHADYRMLTVDINSDGRSDLVTVDPDATVPDPNGSGRAVSANPYTARLFVNRGDGGFVRDDRPLALINQLGESWLQGLTAFHLEGPITYGSGANGSMPIDMNGDASADFLAWVGVPVLNNNSSSGAFLRLYQGGNILDGSGTGATLPGVSSNVVGHNLPQDLATSGNTFAGGDFLGLGSAGFLKMGNNGGNSLWYRQGPPPDLLQTAYGPTGQYTGITYASTAAAKTGVAVSNEEVTSSVYQPTRPALAPPAGTGLLGPGQVPQGTWPIHHAHPATWVVGRTSQDAVGSNVTTAFMYRGMKTDLTGGGSLGFEAVSKFFPYANGGMLVTTTEYLQTPLQPQYLGMPMCTYTRYNPTWEPNNVQVPVNQLIDPPTRPGTQPLAVQAAGDITAATLSSRSDRSAHSLCTDSGSESNPSSGTTRLIDMTTYTYGDVQAQAVAGTLDQPAEVASPVKRPYQQSSIQRSWDLNQPDKAVSKVETRNTAMTAYGDVLTSTATTTGYNLPGAAPGSLSSQSWTKTTQHTYELGENYISGSKWLLGRLKTSSVTATAPTISPPQPDSAALSPQQRATQDPALQGTPLRPEQLMVILQLLLED